MQNLIKTSGCYIMADKGLLSYLIKYFDEIIVIKLVTISLYNGKFLSH